MPSIRPILFSAPMVRALIDGRKTQTRRAIKPAPPTQAAFFGSSFGLCRSVADGVRMISLNQYDTLPKHPTDWDLVGSVGVARDAGFPNRYRCPYGGVGDLLYVREAWQLHERASDVCKVVYRASVGRSWSEAHEQFPDSLAAKMAARPFQHGWRPGIHQPRWSSRLTLEITEVRAQTLHQISEADAIAEGSQEPSLVSLTGAGWSERDVYARLWNSINGKDAWALNPWVWAVSFKVHKANVDAIASA